MRKLATVTAATALVAAMIALPAANAIAAEKEVVILKCEEGDSGPLENAGDLARVQATFSPLPQECEISNMTGTPCVPCIKALMTQHLCQPGAAFPGSPLVVQFSSPNDIDAFSITQYVFQCVNG